MDFKYDKQSAGDAASQGQDKGRQTILLVVLLIMLGGFGYLYFFTGMIRPLEQPAPPQPAPQVVKQPLPAREGEPVGAPSATAPGAPPVTPESAPVAPPAATKPADPAKTAGASVPQAAVKPVQATPAAPVASKAAPKTAPAAVKPAVKKPAAVVAPASPKSVQQAKVVQPKPAPAVKPAPAQPAAPKKVAAKPAVNKPVVQARTGGPWTLVVGSYVVEERLATDMAKVKGAGLNPAMTSGSRRMTTMYRLKYGEYTDREAAQQAVDLLKKRTGEGFSLQKAGKHEVFAGSYAQQDNALAEQQRLSAAGVKVTVQKVQVVVPTRKLTAGTFTDRLAAEAALKKLKQAGVGTPVLE